MSSTDKSHKPLLRPQEYREAARTVLTLGDVDQDVLSRVADRYLDVADLVEHAAEVPAEQRGQFACDVDHVVEYLVKALTGTTSEAWTRLATARVFLRLAGDAARPQQGRVA
ncbi:hypothetical protein KCV87_09965 [Actinosynnema pretiosum subsp. pretiosum]|uniref:Uncharacterized protein n=1 Tax=Actinosynnema pretiosum subsp. pretiosum TaxID=103721 RepID=A0AA45R5V4_9PSEU|nr:hypothetical protein APASM_2043 [Actinosynnema pretiosum subsp. pretiosum]QUF06346.1 hypothetical protein KCV87_09965 [Actinosynnema pretiosum subsp. pretiosum]